MEKKQARDYIKEVLNKSFDQERFEFFMRNLLNEYESKDNSYSGNLIPEAYRDHITYYKRVGKYTDPEGEQLDILIVQTQSVRKLERTRTALRNFVVNRLKKFDKQYGLAAFYSKDDDGAEWRFSFIKIEYESHKNEKGKIKVREELVPAKRFSFLVGKYEGAHTAQKQLLPLLMNDYSDPLIIKDKDGDGSVEGAFSIQKVTDAFYDQYQDLYLKLYNSEKLVNTLKNEGFDPVRFIKKLLGQIVFLYFLQKKGWLGVAKDDAMGEGSKRFLQDRFERAQANGEDYFNDFLRYLFYDALAREHNDEDITYYFKKLGCKVPFLNGGLFEADYDWENVEIPIDNELFRNSDKNKDGDKGTGILDVFDRYNFTIKEDEPLEKEVAVDPEMLGKVFENMLEITERKSKGAFYTPREIVHYMCQESLIHYLDNAINDYSQSYRPIGSSQGSMFGGSADKKGNLNIELEDKGDVRVPKEDIETFIRKGHLALENEEIVENAKQRIAKGEIKSTKHEQLLSESISQNAKQLDKALADIKICDPAIGSGAFPVGLLHEIVTARQVLNSFLQKEERSSYTLKRHAIQNSIYGVDIDASAIDIARLRLWLSMIVDEDDYENIEALPNLDYKIVSGNSLIGFPKDWKSPAFKKIEHLKNNFFRETDAGKKAKLKSKINEEITERLDTSKRIFGYEVDFDFRLFFSEVWRKNNGFDLVIGNPPYLSISKTPRSEDLEKVNFNTYSKTGDLYSLFYEKGNNILKEGGHLCFITSNKWINASYGKKTRKYFAEKTNPLILIDFSKIKIFPSATVFVNILLFESKKPMNELGAVAIEGTRMPSVPIEYYFKENSIDLKNVGKGVWKITTSKGLEINTKIETKGESLKEWDGIEFFRGVTTGLNKAFHIQKDTKERLLRVDKANKKIIKPLLRGRDINRWRYTFDERYMLFTRKGIQIDKYPEVKSYLEQYYKDLVPKDNRKQKRGRKPGNYKWYEIQDNTAYYNLFEKPKIVWIEISNKANYAYDEKGHFLTNSAYFISGENLKYLLAVLNSSVSDYYFFQLTAQIAGGRKRYTKQYVEKIPIPKISKDNQRPFEIIVDYVLTAKSLEESLIFSFFEQLLDALVIELYFIETLKSSGKTIGKHLGTLEPINDQMSNEKKLATIRGVFDRLYDPNHPVRNNLETLDSIEEVRVIKQALK